jgi:hypothetical protein
MALIEYGESSGSWREMYRRYDRPMTIYRGPRKPAEPPKQENDDG